MVKTWLEWECQHVCLKKKKSCCSPAVPLNSNPAGRIRPEVLESFYFIQNPNWNVGMFYLFNSLMMLSETLQADIFSWTEGRGRIFNRFIFMHSPSWPWQISVVPIVSSTNTASPLISFNKKNTNKGSTGQYWDSTQRFLCIESYL